MSYRTEKRGITTVQLHLTSFPSHSDLAAHMFFAWVYKDRVAILASIVKCRMYLVSEGCVRRILLSWSHTWTLHNVHNSIRINNLENDNIFRPALRLIAFRVVRLLLEEVPQFAACLSDFVTLFTLEPSLGVNRVIKYTIVHELECCSARARSNRSGFILNVDSILSLLFIIDSVSRIDQRRTDGPMLLLYFS